VQEHGHPVSVEQSGVGEHELLRATLRAADVVCGSIADASNLLLDEVALTSTLRP
jgi:hypothetical protein